MLSWFDLLVNGHFRHTTARGSSEAIRFSLLYEGVKLLWYLTNTWTHASESCEFARMNRRFSRSRGCAGETPEAANPNEITRCAAVQLTEYFCSKRRAFDLPLSPRGTAFQRTVWRELQAVPFGRTVSYRELGNAGKPSASRAVRGAPSARTRCSSWCRATV